MPKTGPKALRQLDEFAEVGLRCFLHGGYRLTQMADVATALGLSAGAPYRYIESKEALFQVALLHAAGQEVNDIPLPVTLASLEGKVRVVHEILSRWRVWPRLASALSAPRRPTDITGEARMIGLELFDRLSPNAQLVMLLDRCAHDLPKLSQRFVQDVRVPYLANVVTWFARRAAVSYGPGDTTLEAMARSGIEAISWLAMRRRNDDAASAIDATGAREAAGRVFPALLGVIQGAGEVGQASGRRRKSKLVSE